MTTRPPAHPGITIASLYRALWHFSAGARGTLIWALSCLLGAQLVMLAAPYVSGRAINILQLKGTAGLGEAALWLLGIIGISLLSWSLHGPGRFLERAVALRLRQRMSGELIERLVRLPLAWHESQHSGATAHRVQQSVNSMSAFAENQFTYLNNTVRLIGPIVALLVIQPSVGCTAIVGFVLISLSMQSFDRRMIKLAHAENDAERRYSTTILDALGNANTLFALRQARAVIALLQRRLLDVFEPVKRSIVINELKWFTVDIASRTFACLLVGLYVWESTRTLGKGTHATLLLGSLYMVWEYAQQTASVVTAITAQFQSFARLQADYASADPIRDAVEAPHMADAIQPPPRWQYLQLNALDFRHSASRVAPLTLKQVTLKLSAGKRYALIGASGSGKSTLLRVLAGLYVADQVTLVADQCNALSSEAAARYLRSCATLIPQDAEVFEGTLADNLSLCESLLGPPAVADYAHALQQSRASDFVHPTTGLQESIAERGANWSGGQRSRIALARGILAAQGSQLILLDEPTANLDPTTEKLVYENLFASFASACIMSSVHRLNLLNRFDAILLMRDGELIAHGTYTELLISSRPFQQMMSAYDQTVNAEQA